MKIAQIRTIVSALLCSVLMAAALCATGCANDAASQNAASTSTEATQTAETSEVSDGTFEDGAELGEGAVAFTFEVVDVEGNAVTATVNTDAETLGAALLDLGVIAGDDSEYGLYVKTVNGTTLDWDKDGKYWALYIDGEYAQTGVDSTEVEAGKTYSFKAE